jgi:glyoxylase-like metal-dependent hydrolase (beta-lactamase superfamily II)
MTLREFVRFTYGLFMGTSTPLLKPSQRYLFPLKKAYFDDRLSFLLGGSCVCALLDGGGERLIINVNQAGAASALRKLANERVGPLSVALTSSAADFSEGLNVFSDADKIYVGRSQEQSHVRGIKKALGESFKDLVVVQEEIVLDFAGERVRLIPLGAIASNSDMAVYFESRSVLFLGGLFYNRIHPILRQGVGPRIDTWIQCLSGLLDRFQPKFLVPAEGEIGTIEDARLFISYLRDLTDASVEFSRCRELYDWLEIPSHTSLEENFDLLREHRRTHTTLN